MIAVTPSTARRWVTSGKIPGSRIGGQWRFWAPALLASIVGEDAAKDAAAPPGHVEPGVVGVAQLAELLGIHQRTISLLLRQGDLPAQKAGYQWRAYWPTIRDRVAAGQPLTQDAARPTSAPT